MNREHDIYRVTLMGAVINVFLLVIKFVAGVVSGSAAMVADAVHSLSDFLTDIVLVVFVRLGAKPIDDDHEYGHGKYETLASVIIGLSLLVVGAALLYNSVCSVVSVAAGATLAVPGIWAFAAAVISVVLKECTFHVTVSVGRKHDSPAVVANAWHHRSDALSSVGTMIGIGGAILLGERWAVLDPLAAAVVSILIIATAVSLVREACADLLESSLPKDIEQAIMTIAASEPDVSEIHNLRTRRVGNRYAIEMHVRLPGDIPLREAHAHASAIEMELRQQYGSETLIIIHTEPLK